MNLYYILTIIRVFEHKYIHNANIIHCYKNFNVVAAHKIFYQHNMRSHFVHIDDFDTAFTRKEHSKVGFVLNTACENWEHIFDEVDATVSFKYPYFWLIITNDVSKTSAILSKYPIEIDSDVTVVNHLNDTEEIKQNFALYEVFNTGFNKNGTFNIKFAGFLNSAQYTRYNVDRMDLNGAFLKCTVVVTKDLFNTTIEEYLIDSAKDGIDSMHKYKHFMILKYMQDMYNFTMILNSTKSWGYINNGTFDGMVGALINGQADIGGSSVFYRSDRAKLVDYIVETWPSRFSFIFRHPKHPTGVYSIYTRPLNHSVWYCIFALLILIGVSMFVIFNVKIQKSSLADDPSMSLAFLFSLGSLCQQGMPIYGKSAAVKVLIFITLAYSVITYQYYNALIVATLLREPPTTIKSLKSLLESNLKIGIEDVLYNKDYFQRTTDPLAIELYKKKVVYNNHYNFLDPDEGMALVKRGGFAFHIDNNIAHGIIQKTFSEREICETRDVIMYPPQKMAAVIAKRSPYKEHITYGIRRMYEAGLIRRLKISLDVPMPKCNPIPDSSIFSVSIREFSSPLIVLIFGMIISIIILCCEIYAKKITKK